MADELTIVMDTTGLTVTAEVYTRAGVQLGIAVSCAETGSTGIYSGDMPGGAATDTHYDVRFIESGLNVGALSGIWDGSRLTDAPTAAEIRTEMDSNSTQLAAIVADTNELQTDNVPGLIATAQADLDIITGADGVNLLSATQASVDAIEADTNELQTDDVPGLIAALNNISTAQVNAEVDTALADYDGPTHTEMTTAFTEIKGATWSAATDTLEQIGTDTDSIITNVATAQADLDIITGADGVNLLSATQTSIDTIETQTLAASIAAAVWDALIASYNTASTFGELLNNIEIGDIASNVWTYATRTLTAVASNATSAEAGDQIDIIKSVTFTNIWSGLTIPATWTAVYFTVKADKENDDDTESIIQILESNPGAGGDGLLYLNGAAATAAQGSLSVDQGAGTITGVIADNATVNIANLTTGNYYDIKVLLSDGTSQLLIQDGDCDIATTPTQSI